jgi:hypothetical protein
MLKKVLLIPERLLRVFLENSCERKGVFLQAQGKISGKALFANLNAHFTLLSEDLYSVSLEVP